MMTSSDIIEVSEADFDYQVLAYSQKVPVVVDFWADWCIPCRTLGPMLERLTQESSGSFRLAKLDVDRNQNLANRYNVRSIPAVKAFRDGKVVSEFVGVIPEPRLREFFRAIAPNPLDLELEKGLSLLDQGQWNQAGLAFRKVLKEMPANPGAQLGLAKSLLAQGQPEEAQRILHSFPLSREFTAAESLRPLADALHSVKNGPSYSDDPLEAAYFNALRLVLRSNIPAAMDGLLDVLRQDKRFRGGEVRQVLLALFELLGDSSPLTRQYRQELASVLF